MAYIIGTAVVLIVVAVVVYFAMRPKDASAAGSATPASKGDVTPVGVPKPLVADFHVAGDTAITKFEVPLGDAAPGQHLIDLLAIAAVEFLGKKQREGLPLGAVAKIDVQAMRGTGFESISIVELPKVGQLPSKRDMGSVVTAADDPIAAIAAVVADSSVTAQPSTGEDLAPVGSFIQLGGPTEASLRAIGVEPADMSLADLALGLFRIGGYEVQVGRSGFRVTAASEADIYMVSKAGKRSTVVLLPHTPGSYPEVGDRVFSELAVAAGQIDTGNMLLITDKFGPYSMYERERRDKRVVFVTRERLQAFVDSFGLG